MGPMITFYDGELEMEARATHVQYIHKYALIKNINFMHQLIIVSGELTVNHI